MSQFLSFALLLFAACALVECQRSLFRRPEMPKPGAIQPWIPSLDDIRLCKDKAATLGQKIKLVLKKPLETCRPYCMFQEGGEERVNSVDGQLCCDMVGVGPTGTCKDGKCMLGGVMDFNTKDLFGR